MLKLKKKIDLEKTFWNIWIHKIEAVKKVSNLLI